MLQHSSDTCKQKLPSQVMVQTTENGILVLLGSLFFPLLPLLGLVGNIFTFYVKVFMAHFLYHPPKSRTSALRTSLITYILMSGKSPPCANITQGINATCKISAWARAILELLVINCPFCLTSSVWAYPTQSRSAANTIKPRAGQFTSEPLGSFQIQQNSRKAQIGLSWLIPATLGIWRYQGEVSCPIGYWNSMNNSGEALMPLESLQIVLFSFKVEQIHCPQLEHLWVYAVGVLLSSFPLVENLRWTRKRCGPIQEASLQSSLTSALASAPP